MPGKQGTFRRKTVPKHLHPLVARVFERANELCMNYDQIAEASGVSEKAILRWRLQVEPALGSIEAVLNAMDLELVAVPMTAKHDTKE